MKNFLLIVFLLTVSAIRADPLLPYQPPVSHASYRGSAVVGVDALGRFLVGVDTDADGLADYCFLYTGKTRLTDGPWSELLVDASIRFTEGPDWATLTLDDGTTFVRLGLRGAPLALIEGGTHGRQIIHDDGLELVQVRAPAGGGGVALATMSHADLQSWPEVFHYDLLSPASAVNCAAGAHHSCIAGGLAATSCDISSGAGGLCTEAGGCSVTCAGWPRWFACCQCFPFSHGDIFPDEGTRPYCRCHPCIRFEESNPRPGDPPSQPN